MEKGGRERKLQVQMKQIWINSFLFAQVGTSWSNESKLFAQGNSSGRQYEALGLSLDSVNAWICSSAAIFKTSDKNFLQSKKMFQIRKAISPTLFPFMTA